MVKFGVAGYPPAYNETPFKKDRLKIFEWIRGLGLDAFEAQMTYGPRTTVENCRLMRDYSLEYDVKISIHAAYYIVLTSSDKAKIRRSIDTLKKTFELADIIGADAIVLHPGPYYNDDPEKIYDVLSKNLTIFFNEIGSSGIGLFLETAGKKGQLGSVDEVLSLSREVKGCYPCIDFGHVHARTNGGLQTKKAIDDLFITLKQSGALNDKERIHFHYTPIHYGPQGEITHKAIEDFYPVNPQQSLFFDAEIKDNFYHPRYERIIDNIKNINIPFTVISETYNSQERGALAMKKYYSGLL